MIGITAKDLRELIHHECDRCVSIYMPTHRDLGRSREDITRLKNLLAKAEEELTARGMRRPVAEEMLAPASALLRQDFFWEHLERGLAIFLDNGFAKVLKFDSDPGEFLGIGRRFYIKPIVPHVSPGGTYYALLLSSKRIELYRCNRLDMEAVPLPVDVPEGIQDILKYEDFEEHVGFHTAGNRTTGPGRGVTMHHGQSDMKTEGKDQALRYFRLVDEHLRAVMPDYQTPLVLVGVEYFMPLYREANTYPSLVDEAVEGSPETMTPGEIHARSWRVMEPFFDAARHAAVERLAQSLGTGRASEDVDDILRSALEGRVGVLLFASARSDVWGRYDAAERRSAIHDNPDPDDEDLTNYAAIETLDHGGAVYAVAPEDIPNDAPMGALFRY